MTRVLKSVSEDDIVKLYCIKTVENITAQSQVTSRAFLNDQFIAVLVNLVMQNKLESIRVSAMIVLCNLVRLDDSFSLRVLETIGARSTLNWLKHEDANPRMPVALLSIINFAMIQYPQDTTQFLNVNASFCSVLFGLLERNDFCVQAKSLLTLYILLNIDKDKYLLCINHDNKLMAALEKLSKDQNKYITSCLNHLLVFLADQFIHFIEGIENELTVQA